MDSVSILQKLHSCLASGQYYRDFFVTGVASMFNSEEDLFHFNKKNWCGVGHDVSQLTSW